MKKEHLYACMCVFFVTLSICVIVATHTYRTSVNNPKARVSLGGEYITYEVPVESPYDAARLFFGLKSMWEKASVDVANEEARRREYEAKHQN